MQILQNCGKRLKMLERAADSHFDVAIVGGGINGAASAAALSAVGISVLLLERGDFASGTSQESSNLAWGGIKYLENGELGLVRGLCRSRNRLMDAFPGSVRETRFLLSHESSFRHGLRTLYAGSWLYWVLGQRRTQAPQRLGADALGVEAPIVRSGRYDGALAYSDARFVDGDARFVFGFVRRAWDRGAVALNYVDCEAAEYEGGRWRMRARDLVGAQAFTSTADVLINACGPWADTFAECAGAKPSHRHLFSKGIHLVVPKLETVDRVLAFFADDGRLFFAIPFGNRTCVGTTDTRVDTPDARIADDDRQFVLDNVNARLSPASAINLADVIAERCGVRPLAVPRGGDESGEGDWLQMSRKHVIEADARLPAYSIYGGKLTDCINIGREIVGAVASHGLAVKQPSVWYGEDAFDSGIASELREICRASAAGCEPLPTGGRRIDYLWRRYGEALAPYFELMRDDPSCFEPISSGCDAMRLDWEIAKRAECVVTSDDFLRRRTLVSSCSRMGEILDGEWLGAAAKD